MTNRARIERFVRDTLGCTCPAEVFEIIEDERRGSAEPPTPRCLAIGGRLLVYLVSPVQPPEIPRLAEWVRQGKAERDTRAMNRFRLVVALDAPDAIRAELEADFRRLPAVDDRVHLHLVERAALAEL